MTSAPDDPQVAEDSGPEPALSSLATEHRPPPELEGRVLESLRSRGLIGRTSRPLRTPRAAPATLAAIAALVLLALALGWGLGVRSAASAALAPAAVAGEDWMLLLYEDGSYRSPPPEGRAARIREYAEWARRLEAAGALVSAGELDATGTLLVRAGERVVEEARVPASDLGVVAGYFVIRADSYRHALALANGCPHLEHGGRVSLRRVGSS